MIYLFFVLMVYYTLRIAALWWTPQTPKQFLEMPPPRWCYIQHKYIYVLYKIINANYVLFLQLFLPFGISFPETSRHVSKYRKPVGIYFPQKFASQKTNPTFEYKINKQKKKGKHLPCWFTNNKKLNTVIFVQPPPN